MWSQRERASDPCGNHNLKQIHSFIQQNLSSIEGLDSTATAIGH